MDKELISIIIPVYNLEDYLTKCIDSILKQTYKNFEIILINDGSTDGSEIICEKYKNQYSFITYIKQRNLGAASARNASKNYINGKYITFIDGDDIVTKDYLESLYSMLTENKADMAVCALQRFFDESEIKQIHDKNENIILFNNEEALKNLLYRRIFTAGPCGKLFNKDIFLDNLFPEGRLFEDLGVTYKWYASAHKIVYSSAVKYYYFMRSGSSQHSDFSIKKWDSIEISREIMDYVGNKYPKLKKASISRFFISNVQILRAIPLKKQYKNYHLELKNNIKKSRKTVLFDSENKFTTRILAGFSYLGLFPMILLGRGYDYFIAQLKIKLKY